MAKLSVGEVETLVLERGLTVTQVIDAVVATNERFRQGHTLLSFGDALRDYVYNKQPRYQSARRANAHPKLPTVKGGFIPARAAKGEPNAS